mmetsp:Transcript_19976/g.28697  ORF Transcript_19976/g.28697 Transcript_19976/m.28697 type:complete len:121 (-) Transcript_19976:165-527(-)|eukprot:CAMPEP_0185024722 /NCGR_PEP_ID=MMETSP1103-20130426/7908_1 /TAXON_ID=36769 /ORGANISM="Paraphysomonas bandaiensis, Strain Caron Lab Isolate" /LENGTH=120 /DNA_ID=CAMNT_0027557765 /DNA_START=71 /DNA_END=433 /DNA_ORIENTATION=-
MSLTDGYNWLYKATCSVLINTTPTAVGAALGSAAVLGGFAAVGLSPVGPIAGGFFAANMGAGLTSGGVMAVAQSLAMTGKAYAVGATVGAVTGAAVGYPQVCGTVGTAVGAAIGCPKVSA